MLKCEEIGIYVPVYNNGSVVTHTIVSKEDYDWVSKYVWRLQKDRVYRNKNIIKNRATQIFLSVAIINPAYGMDVDHENQNTLDNRRSNLRQAYRHQNGSNRGKSYLSWNPHSRYKGVSRSGDNWVAYITHQRKRVYLGRYKTEEDAALAYNYAAIKLHGEFAYLNVVDGVEPSPLPDSRVKLLTYKGLTLSVAAWARRLGITDDCLRARLKNKWPLSEALK